MKARDWILFATVFLGACASAPREIKFQMSNVHVPRDVLDQACKASSPEAHLGSDDDLDSAKLVEAGNALVFAAVICYYTNMRLHGATSTVMVDLRHTSDALRYYLSLSGFEIVPKEGGI